MSHHPLVIEVVTHVTGSMNHCDHCQVFIDGVGIGERVHQQDLSSYPEDFIRDWQRVSDWVLALAETFPGRLVIRITDAQSPRGLWKSLTQRVRKYPTFIIGGETLYHGWDRAYLDTVIQKHLSQGQFSP